MRDIKQITQFHDALMTRYSRLYGRKDCGKQVGQDENGFLLKCAIAGVVLLVTIFTSLLAGTGAYDGLTTNEKGEITQIMRPSQKQGAFSFSTEVEVDIEGRAVAKEYCITIQPKGSGKPAQEEILPEKSEEETIETEIRQLISGLNADTSSQKLSLPQELKEGQKLTWRKVEDSNTVLYIMAALAAALFLYKTRFYRVEREERRARESIIRELPEFINKIVLLLNAGSVLNAAFMKAMDDYEKSGGKGSYFYGQMEQINRSIQEANGSLHEELQAFAKRSRVKELMRVTNIITDNISKGADLSDKLKRENDLLWFSRKQNAEEKGRLAETKMTMPLVILLMVLILITIAPAMMNL